jgi:hypothetical protein
MLAREGADLLLVERPTPFCDLLVRKEAVTVMIS